MSVVAVSRQSVKEAALVTTKQVAIGITFAAQLGLLAPGQLEPDYTTMTAAELKAALDARDVAYPAKANKAALIALLEA